MTCKEARAHLGAFIDDELSAIDRESLEEHLSDCVVCARRAAFESNFNRMLRENLQEDEVPASLLPRVRCGLAEESRRGREARSWFLRPAAGWALAASLVVAFVLPAGLGHGLGLAGWEAILAGDEHALHGVLVCLHCDRAGASADLQRRCRAFGHGSGIRTEAGDYWSFAPRGAGAELAGRPELRGERVRLVGPSYPEIRVVDVQSYELEG